MTRTLVLLTSLAIAFGGALALAHDGEDHSGSSVDHLLPDGRIRGVPKRPTYHKHVAKILNQNCTSCHHDGDIGPMPLDNYADASDFSERILEEIGAGAMPPWRPTHGVGDFAGERRLSVRQIATLLRWHQQGAPEGKPPRKPVVQEFPDGWTLGTPDAAFAYGESFPVPGDQDDIYRCFPIQTSFGKDVYVQALDVRPGDRRVVHHVVLYVDTVGESHDLDAAETGPGYICFGGPGLTAFADLEAGELPDGEIPSSPVLGGWAPGNRPYRLPPGVGIRIPDGATIVMQVHYHPVAGEVIDDATEFGLYLTDDPDPEEVLLLPIVNQEFTIPAGDPSYTVTERVSPTELMSEFTGLDIPVAGEVYAVLPHMHLLGRAIRVDAELPDGTEQRLVEIEDWSFDWQDSYFFEKPVAIPAGGALRLECVYDNSTGNPLNPNVPPQPVSWGERTVDEMALAFVAVALRFPDSVLALFELAGIDPPHPRGLPAVRTNAPPTIRKISVNAKGTLRVKVGKLSGGGRIEIDGVPIGDSMKLGRRVRKLQSAVDWFADFPVRETRTIRVRRADGRLSEPVFFTR